MAFRALQRCISLGLALPVAVAGAGCCRGVRAIPDRPHQPTLTLVADAKVLSSGRRIVASGQIAQPWRIGAWAPASITLRDVMAGDAILVLGVFWGDLPPGASTAPTDDRGTLVAAVDQGPAVVGRTTPPVFAQVYVELDAAPGPHTIIPPHLGGQAGDGTLYVAQVRGLTEHRLVATGQARVRGTGISNLSVELRADADLDDLVVAIGGYDNTEQRERAGWSHPPAGWLPLGVQEDAANNVPSSACQRAAPGRGRQAVTWTWTDPKANVACAVIVALR
jgi:hypothetical protein